MANLNIKFNNKSYSIDSASLADATARLEAHLVSMMNGSEVLEGDGAEYYTLAPTPLSFRSTAPLSELQEVTINGEVVDPSNYTLEEGSTIVTFPIDYLKTLNVGSYEVDVVSESKSVKGNFTVAAPELNEHGFYYNQPYSANLPMFGGDTALFVREDGTYDIITVGKTPNTGEYTIDGNAIVATHIMLGTIHCTISSDGQSIYCAEVGANFELSGSTAIAADDDYVYVYYEELGGYEVKAIDKTKAEPGAIKTCINGIDTVKLANDMFAIYDESGGSILNKYLICAPQIPDSVTTIGNYAFSECTSITSIDIPNSVTSIGYNAFYDCDGLTSIEIPDSVTSIGSNAFKGCQGLINVNIGNGIITIDKEMFSTCIRLANVNIGNNVTTIDNEAFYNCNALTSIVIPASVTYLGSGAFKMCNSLTDIIFEGTVEQWNSIEKYVRAGTDTGWNYCVPATHVHCTDGDVAL